ncbi:MAG: hypothetical protein QOD66_3504 [Solirubrobacteraceae bacterium]|jgi:hypothetical protein|nr:hypothetical protein [Solirubrobacteraceae bacterium]
MSLLRTPTRARRLLLLSFAALTLGAGLSACGSSSSTASAGTAATSSSRTQARLNLAKCFRAHGLNVPDPGAGGGAAGAGGGGGGGGIFRSLNGYSQSQVQAATAACRSYFAKAFPQANLSPAQRAQVQQQLVKFAQCMRSHGVNIPDPTFNGTSGFGFRRAFGSVDRNSPAFVTASKACASVRPRFGPGGGGGAGGGPGAPGA